jgi:hypothetical protein
MTQTPRWTRDGSLSLNASRKAWRNTNRPERFGQSHHGGAFSSLERTITRTNLERMALFRQNAFLSMSKLTFLF